MKAMAENFKRTWQEQFHLQNREPEMWGHQAFELFHVSDVLNARFQAAAAAHRADAPNLWRNYYQPNGSMIPIWDRNLIKHVNYFRALGIENLLKAILISREEKPGRSHDLVILADRARCPTTPRQQTLLRELTAVIRWSSRYVMPLDFDDVTPREGLRDFPSLPGDIGEAEEREIIELIRQLVKQYSAALAAFEPIRRKRSKADWQRNQPGIPWPGEDSAG